MAAAGLWFYRRWALWFFAGTSLAVIGLDVAARGPALPLSAAAVSSAMVSVLAYLVRARFRKEGPR